MPTSEHWSFGVRAIGPLKTERRVVSRWAAIQNSRLLQSFQYRIIGVGNKSSRYYAGSANHRWAQPMRKLLITAFEDAVAQIKAEVALTPLIRWN
jgi:hypothetical protein